MSNLDDIDARFAALRVSIATELGKLELAQQQAIATLLAELEKHIDEVDDDDNAEVLGYALAKIA